MRVAAVPSIGALSVSGAWPVLAEDEGGFSLTLEGFAPGGAQMLYSKPQYFEIPLALLPGLILDRTLFEAQLEALSDIAQMAVADLTQLESVQDMAAKVLSEMPERFALAGLSMGGYVAFEIQRQAPERVTHLALLNTKATLDPPHRQVDGWFADDRLMP